MTDTPNHGYNRPSKGDPDWHTPLNNNFKSLDKDIEIRGEGAPDPTVHDPADGVKYLDTLNGVVYLSDGSSWNQAFDITGGGVESLTGGDGINPGTINDGDMVSVAWEDANELDSTGAVTNNTLTVAGNAVSLGGSTGVTYVDLGDTGSSFPIPNTDLANSSLSIAGNSVSLGGSTGVTYVDLSDTGGSFPIPTGDLDTPFSTLSTLFGNPVTTGATLDLAGDVLTDGTGDVTIQGAAGNGVIIETDSGSRTLELGVPKSDGTQVAGGNVVAGHPNNTVNNSAVGVTIGGGGAENGNENTVGDDYATVGGGYGNTASGFESTVGGGYNNTTSEINATVGGGVVNTASGAGATVPGGQAGAAENNQSFVWNDGENYHAIPNTSLWGGLSSNQAVDGEPVTGPNTFHASARNGFRFITGGSSSQSVVTLADDGSQNAQLRTWSGGLALGSAAGNGVTIETDSGSRTLELGVPTSDGTRVAGGNVVAGHPNNTVNNSAVGVTIGGGGAGNNNENTVGAAYGTVSGGRDNQANGTRSVIGGGRNNETSAAGATVGGGDNNTASGTVSTVPGGAGNIASGGTSFAAGNDAGALDPTAFVWNDGFVYHDIDGDGTNEGLSSSEAVNGEPVNGAGTFSVGATGGIRMITGSSAVTYIDGASTGWSTASSQAVKTNIDPVEPREALAGVDNMDVATWEYEDDDGEGAGTTHIGPMAEDFHEAFDVGSSDEHINAINADGVAFAAIQGLSAKLEEHREELEEKEEQIDSQAGRIEDLEAENDRLRNRLAAIEEHIGLGDSRGTTQGVADD